MKRIIDVHEDTYSNFVRNEYSRADVIAIHAALVNSTPQQEPILDKIRAEIEQGYCEVNNDYDHGRNYGLYMATQIINKYKAGSEEV